MSKPKLIIKCSETGKSKNIFWDMQNTKVSELINFIQTSFKVDLKIRSAYGSVDGFHYNHVNESDFINNFAIIRDIQKNLTFQVKGKEKSSSSCICCAGDIENKIITIQSLKNNFTAIQYISTLVENELVRALTSQMFISLVAKAVLNNETNIEIASFKKTFIAEIFDDKYLCFIYAGLRYIIMLDKLYHIITKNFKFKNTNYNIYLAHKADALVVFLSFSGDVMLRNNLVKFEGAPILINVPNLNYDQTQLNLELSSKDELIKKLDQLIQENTAFQRELKKYEGLLENKLLADAEKNKNNVEKRIQENEMMKLKLEISELSSRLFEANEIISYKNLQLIKNDNHSTVTGSSIPESTRLIQLTLHNNKLQDELGNLKLEKSRIETEKQIEHNENLQLHLKLQELTLKLENQNNTNNDIILLKTELANKNNELQRQVSENMLLLDAHKKSIANASTKDLSIKIPIPSGRNRSSSTPNTAPAGQVRR